MKELASFFLKMLLLISNIMKLDILLVDSSLGYLHMLIVLDDHCHCVDIISRLVIDID